MRRLRVPRTADGRPWVEVEGLLLGRDGRDGPFLRRGHLFAPHRLLGDIRYRRDAQGVRIAYADPDMVVAYERWRDRGGFPPEIRPMMDFGRFPTCLPSMPI